MALAKSIPIDADGRFSGYASLFNTLDAGGDMVMPGAFAQSLAKRRGRVRLLFQHDPKEPVGIWESLGEDRRGLFVSGRLVPGVPRADAIRRLIESRALDGLSIGFRTVKATRQGGHRKLWTIDLYEISVVTFPMLEDARIAPSGLSSTGAAIAAAISVLRNP
ncbi:HK97 family phage prohead protease [uncultured Devosia sp.]|uniref:HK97 family phage prohead protease n=1 Tax=uncultured Devosia sp. TaxID=211434 RepID=UPI0035CC3729